MSSFVLYSKSRQFGWLRQAYGKTIEMKWLQTKALVNLFDWSTWTKSEMASGLRTRSNDKILDEHVQI